MHRHFIAVVLLAGVTIAPKVAQAATPFELKSVTVTLPDSDRMFPAGPGGDQINGNCLICHSASMVLNQPALRRKVWAAEVDKMIEIYKAPVPPQDVGAIVDYLVNLRGAR
ncbi:cytochrome c [Methylovirgula sp. HY1]|uniref:cytochrome c n=1 Tax=Methylovirgula sp. HY1 TaxID=2822761 RepID=UPI001C5BA40E|nr:cytochrome c [Methylovirgula sp. HY1]QXX76573.1 sulfite:cytochrome c oxidoreductase cytochrome subunit SorB [Methylovirgula sp. HY1]